MNPVQASSPEMNTTIDAIQAYYCTMLTDGMIPTMLQHLSISVYFLHVSFIYIFLSYFFSFLFFPSSCVSRLYE